MFQPLLARGFDVLVRNHAEAILSGDFPAEAAELIETLADFSIGVGELVTGGGGEAGQTQRLRRALAEKGWEKHNFFVETIVDGVQREAMSHEIDHVRRGPSGVLALEIEWNNKDPFFDRDLENFQRLHGQSAISLGIVVTRGRSLQDRMLDRIASWMSRQGLGSEADLERLGLKDRTERQRRAVQGRVDQGMFFAEAFARVFVADKFGPSTTHWAKLEDRVMRGVGNPCPLVLIGLPDGILVE